MPISSGYEILLFNIRAHLLHRFPQSNIKFWSIVLKKKLSGFLYKLSAAELILIISMFFLASCAQKPNRLSTILDSQKSFITLEATSTVDESQEPDLIQEAIQQALYTSIENHKENVLSYMLYKVLIDHIDFSEDHQLALVWLALQDTDTNQILPGEPGLAIASYNKDAAQWDISLQSDTNWLSILKSIPSDLLADDIKELYIPHNQAIQKDHTIYSGYLLPWEGGKAVRVSGSIGHVFTYKSCPSSCLYAFDFADGTMFPVLAAKSGIVKYAVWKYPNGNTENANYIVLEDRTTTPTTYQVYFHLAQDSIPEEFRTPGAKVLQGQYIGRADDTGYSTGQHLHFHVHTNSTSYWGTSVDITFSDVKINGGRPRTCTEASAYPEYGSQCQSGNWFISGNGDTDLPTGVITQPFPNETLTTPLLTVRGEGFDDSAIAYTQIMVNTGDGWQPVGPLISENPFTSTIDLCNSNIPNGSFFLSLQLMDKSGKISEGLPGLTNLTKNYTCLNEIPGCNPGENQVAIYTETNYHGACALLDIGEYNQLKNLSAIGDNNIDSIQVGQNVMISVFSEENKKGDRADFVTSSASLVSTPIGINQASSAEIKQKPSIPAPTSLIMPALADGSDLTDQDPVVLKWKAVNGENIQYSSRIDAVSGFSRETGWQTETQWDLGNLPSGTYTWTVIVKNLTGQSTASLQFNIISKAFKPETAFLPISESLESTAIPLKWEVLKDADQIDHFEIQFRQNNKDWEILNTTLSESARQTWFIGEMGQTYSFRIRAIDKTGRFEVFDPESGISVHIASTCTADKFEQLNQSDSSWDSATEFIPDQSQKHNLCGENDEDWVVFSAEKGQTFQVVLTPSSPGVFLSAAIYGIDHKYVLSTLESSSDEKTLQTSFTAPETQIYYLQIMGKDAGLVGTDTEYELRIDRSITLKPLDFIWTSLLFPILWGILKLFSGIKSKLESKDHLSL